jgi:N-methylhydantoinase A
MSGARSSGAAEVSIIAIDTGGTFTDVVCRLNGRLTVLKVPSTPSDPAAAVLAGIAAVRSASPALRGAPPPPFTLLHGSTVATNSLLERRVARVALITNAGFEDVIEIGRQNRPQLYALVGTRPPPLVPRELRFGVAGRLGPDGVELEPVDPAELHELPARLRDVDAIAICLLHSYANPAHERAVVTALEPLGLPVSVSSQLLPEFREYERTATTVINACITPVMDHYLGRIERESGASRVRIMGSGGGAIPLTRARREAVHTVLSGPAGGVIGALEVARRAGIDHIITFDMGGTSTDVSLCPGRPLHTREFAIADLPVAIPVLDVHTVGAGGGSIARVDAGGALRVGPASAGAEPGPICYGRGGTRVTVTDANVYLGRLPASSWRHALDSNQHSAATGPDMEGDVVAFNEAGAAASGLDTHAIRGPLASLADALRTDLEGAAEGVVAVANASMERALRVISVERGHDPADFTLVPFGGAAGLHAAALAERLGIPRILVPPHPGVLSAFGMLVAAVRKEVSRTVLWHADEAGTRLRLAFDDLEADARSSMAAEGIPDGVVAVNRSVDARYLGQSFELSVPATDDWVELFHAAHLARYGYDRTGAVVEAVTLRVEALAPGATMQPQSLAHAGSPDPEPVGRGAVMTDGTNVDATHYRRETLLAGHRLAGPCVVLEYSSTLWLPPGWNATVLEDGSLLAGRAEG